jgi:ribosomal protein S18 acetylase RimI-like enzyme
LSLQIRPATPADDDAIWAILEPVIRCGEVYALPRDWTRERMLAEWYAEGYAVFVADDAGEVVGTYHMHANQRGGGAHVANCGYATAAWATGRGIAAAMCAHSLDEARRMGFAAMQFNFVISTNTRAVALWQRMGFDILARLPGVFHHPAHGYVDAFVMFQNLA